MRGLIAIVLLVIFGVVSAAVPTRLSFTKGQQIVYKLHGTVDARGNIETQGTTDGTTSTMDSVMVIKCVDMDSTSYTFVMNMFDTTVSVNEETSVVKVEEATSSSALGYDMYFQQAVTGEVQKIWYDTRDSQYFVNVKVSAINALQTTVTAPGTSQTVLESDPLGVHYSEFTGSASSNDDTLLVNKAFSQKDFEKFSDPDVTPKNVILMARAATGIHPSGFIQSAQTEQFATVDNMSRTSYSFGKAKGVNTNSTGFDMDMQSHGVLNIDYSSQSVVSSNAGSFFLNHAQSKKELETRDSIASVASLFDLAVAGVLQSKKEIPVFAADIESTLKQVLSSGSVKSQMNSIHKIVRFFKLTKEHKASQLLLPYFMELQKTRNAALREKLFIIATSLGDLNVYQQLAKYGLKGGDKEIQYHALLAITSGVRESSAHLIAAVFKIMNNEDTDAQVRDAAYMAYGSLLSYSDDRNFVTFGKNTLIGALKSAMSKNDNRMIVSALGAISNAGSAIVPVTEIPYTLFSHSELMVRTAAMFVLQKQAKKGSQSAKKIIDVLTAKDDPDYPYNKDYKVDWSVGGKTVSAKFDAELFVGTNFDCNHPTFNYKGLAEATGGVALFGVEQQVFDARALYAKKGSQLVGDELFLSVFDKVLFQKSIGALVDCTEHTYDLYHAAPGFSLSYTVWVSIVPITFRASASAVLDAKWGWQICDSQLSALVELVPSAELIVSGDAEIDLLIVKGELELDGTFAAAVVPQAYVHGTECAIGIDVKLNTQPMDAKLEAFYMIKKCKFLFFDCKWGPRDNHVFWEWQLPSKSDTLYDKEWKIGTD